MTARTATTCTASPDFTTSHTKTGTNVGDDEPSIIMGVQHRTAPIYGVQFHPESVLSDEGIACWRILSISLLLGTVTLLVVKLHRDC